MSGSPSRSKSQNGDAEALAGGVGDARRARDVGERAIAVVAKQPVRHPIEHRRMAVHAVAVLAQAAERVLLQPEVEVVGDVEVEIAVAVVVEKARAGAPLRGAARDPGGGRHVGEGAVAVVLVEDVGTEARDEEIEVAVPVVVADGDAGLVGALAGAAPVHARLRGHIRERPVLVVAVEDVGGARRAVHEVEILEAVVVVVDPGDARAEGLDHVLLGRGSRLVHERDERLGGHVGEGCRASRFGLCRLARR